MNFVTQDSTKDPHFSVASRLPAEQGDLFAIIGRLWKRKLLILCLTVLIAAPIVLVIRGLTPWYRAEGQVMVEDRRTQVILVPDVRTDRPLQEDSILSEAQVLLSRDLAREVVKKLDLADDPEFNPPKHSSLLDQGLTKLAAVAASLSLPLPSFLHQGATPPAPGETEKETRLVDAFLTRLSAAPAGRSRVIRIMFESQSPQMAAKAVNAIASVYLERQIRIKSDAAHYATDWIQSRLAAYRDKAEAARLEIEKFRNQSGILQADKDTTLSVREAVAVGQQLTAARAHLAELQTRLASVKDAVAHGKPDSVPEIMQSITIQTLRQSEAGVRARLAELQIQFGTRHPAVAQAQAQIDDIHQSIAREMDRILRSLSDDTDREKANVDRLSARYDSVKRSEVGENEASAKMVTLDRQLSSNDAIYTMFLDRAKQTELQEGTQQADAWVISHADAPDAPFFPKTGTLAALAVLTSALVSMFVVLAFDRKKAALLGLEQTRAALGVDVLAALPQAGRRLRGPQGAAQLYLAGAKRTLFAAALRNLHVRLGVAPSAATKTLLFASALPGEGKTTTAIAFATMLADVGRRVILVDCDSHRPRIHEAFGGSRERGLTTCLEGAAWQPLVKHDAGLGVDFLPAGASVSHPSNLLGSARMKTLLNELAAAYDAVVLDSPPVLAVPDTLVLAPLVGQTLFLVQWGKTPQAAAERGMQLLSDGGGDVTGVVLSLVDLDKMAAADPKSDYHRRLASYYTA